MSQITGVDYLTGDTYPLTELRFVVSEDPDEMNTDSSLFVVEGEEFADFVAAFCKRYGVACDGRSPTVVHRRTLKYLHRIYEFGEMKL